MKTCHLLLLWTLVGIAGSVGGCALVPETRYRDSLHNPFPQLGRVAVLPFFNQSDEPTVNSVTVAESYYAALQAVPGFEVLPVGVTQTQWDAYSVRFGEPRTGDEFQRFAQFLGVDAIVVGSVTDFDAYYPPRVGLSVHWYAANPGFHPIPAGYGLPWGTEAEDQIPRRIVREAEFELARSQLRTQTPLPASAAGASATPSSATVSSDDRGVAAGMSAPTLGDVGESGGFAAEGFVDDAGTLPADSGTLPADWPDPTDLIPDSPSPVRPIARVNHEPVLTHTRLFRGTDPYVTEKLADYVETGDDARPSGWRGYLNRSEDFVRFCCHLHVTEMLESRGGRDESDLILRWPLDRY